MAPNDIVRPSLDARVSLLIDEYAMMNLNMREIDFTVRCIHPESRIRFKKLTITFHSASRIHCIAEQTIPWHGETNNTSAARSCDVDARKKKITFH